MFAYLRLSQEFIALFSKPRYAPENYRLHLSAGSIGEISGNLS